MEQNFESAERQLFTISSYYEYYSDLLLAIQYFTQDLNQINEEYVKLELPESELVLNILDPANSIRDPFRILQLTITDTCKVYEDSIQLLKSDLDSIANSYRLRTGMSLWDEIEDLNDTIEFALLDTMVSGIGAIRSFADNSYYSVSLHQRMQGEWIKRDVNSEKTRNKMII